NRMHAGESFAALRIKNYKNFLRLKFKPDKLTIYPLAIDKVPGPDHWMNAPRGKANPLPNNPKLIAIKPIDVRLIENPIVIATNDEIDQCWRVRHTTGIIKEPQLAPSASRSWSRTMVSFHGPRTDTPSPPTMSEILSGRSAGTFAFRSTLRSSVRSERSTRPDAASPKIPDRACTCSVMSTPLRMNARASTSSKLVCPLARGAQPGGPLDLAAVRRAFTSIASRPPSGMVRVALPERRRTSSAGVCP